MPSTSNSNSTPTSTSTPTATSAAVAVAATLLVVGAPLAVAPALVADDPAPTYTVTRVPSEGGTASAAAAVSDDVLDLDHRLSDAPAGRRLVDRAVRDGAAEGAVPTETRQSLARPAARYAVRDGRYYAWTARRVGDESIRVETRPVAPAAVLATVSAPAAEAPPRIRRAIESGSEAVETERFLGAEGLYRHEGAYYAVDGPGVLAVLARSTARFLAALVAPAGRGYAAVGAGLLWYLVAPRLSRVGSGAAAGSGDDAGAGAGGGAGAGTARSNARLTPVRAAVVASLAVPVALFATLLVDGGADARFLLAPAAAVVVSGGLLAGVLARRRRWGTLVGLTAGVVALGAGVALGVGVAAAGPVGTVTGATALVPGLLAGIVPFGVGVALGAPASSA